jgi:hypothetical protein
LRGYGVALGASLALGALLLRTSGWTVTSCDAFAAPLWRAAQTAALAPLLLGVASLYATGMVQRGVAIAVIGGGALAGAIAL